MAARQQASTISDMSSIKEVWCRNCHEGKNVTRRSDALYGMISVTHNPVKVHWVCRRCLYNGPPDYYNFVTRSKATRDEYVENDGSTVIRIWPDYTDERDPKNTYYGYENEDFTITDYIVPHSRNRMCATCGKHKVSKISQIRDNHDGMLFHDWYCADVDKYGCVKTKCWPNPKLLGTV
jgi:hypothetical protein